MNNFHRIENNPTPSECSTPILDEWSAFATFLADVIEKYASVLEIDNAVSSTNNKIDKILLIPLLQHDIIFL